MDFPKPKQIRELPVQLEMEVPPDWEDRNGHVNVQYYLKLYEIGGWGILEQDGFDEDWFKRHRLGMFDLENHLSYRAEIHVGDTVSTFNRILGTSDRRFHGMYLVVNDTRDELAATIEYVTACVDLETRRMASTPVGLKRHLDRVCIRHGQLGWPAPICGAINP